MTLYVRRHTVRQGIFEGINFRGFPKIAYICNFHGINFHEINFMDSPVRTAKYIRYSVYWFRIATIYKFEGTTFLQGLLDSKLGGSADL